MWGVPVQSRVRDKSTVSRIVCLIVLSLIIVFTFGITFAYFSDKETSHSQQVQFGKISITTNNDSSVVTEKWFGDRAYAQTLSGGSATLQNDIKFNLADDSQPCYIRVKYSVDLESGADAEFEKAYKYLKYRDLTLSSSSDYTWSEKRGDYYYLLGSDGNPLKVSTKRSSDYVFLTKENSILPSSLYFGETSQTDKVKMSISIEALQVANIEKSASDSSLIDTIERELNAINYTEETNPSSITTKYTVNFHINGSVYSFNNIPYAGSQDLSSNINVTSILNQPLSLWENGLTIISRDGNNHTYIKDNTIYNVTENLDIYLAIPEITFTVSFLNDDSTVLQKSTVKQGESVAYYGSTPISNVDNTKIFNGWSNDTTNITADTTTVATYIDATKSYSITYNLNGGNFGKSAVKAYDGTTTVTLPTKVYKEGSIFGGWFSNSSLTGTQVTSISSGSSGNKTYYAKWNDVVARVSNGISSSDYSSIAEAINNSSSGDTISILKDSSDAIALSGKTLTIVNGNASGVIFSGAITINSSSNITLGGNGNQSGLTALNITVDSTSTLQTKGGSYTQINNNGTVSVNNSTVNYIESSKTLTITGSDINGQIYVSGGTANLNDSDIVLTKKVDTSYGINIDSANVVIENSTIVCSDISISKAVYCNSSSASITINSSNLNSTTNSTNYIFESNVSGATLSLNNATIDAGTSPVIGTNFIVSINNVDVKSSSSSQVVNLSSGADTIQNLNLYSSSASNTYLVIVTNTATITGGTYSSSSTAGSIFSVTGSLTLNKVTAKTASGIVAEVTGTLTLKELTTVSSSTTKIVVTDSGKVNLSSETSEIPTIFLNSTNAKIVATTKLTKRFNVDGTKTSGNTLVTTTLSGLELEDLMYNFNLVGNLESSVLVKNAEALVLG